MTSLGDITTWIEGISLGVGSWIVTGILSLVLGYIFATYTQRKKVKSDSKMLNETLGIVKIYPSREEAIKDQLPRMIKAKEILFLAYTGFALIDKPVFVDSTFFKVINNWKQAGTKDIKVLLLSPQEVEIIKRRIERINLKDIQPSEKEIRKDIDDLIKNTQLFSEASNSDRSVHVEVGYFHSELLWCILIYENVILWSFYEGGKTANWARTLLISDKSLIGITLLHYFQDLWERREEANSQTSEIDNSRMRGG